MSDIERKNEINEQKDKKTELLKRQIKNDENTKHVHYYQSTIDICYMNFHKIKKFTICSCSEYIRYMKQAKLCVKRTEKLI